jgi:hypothetical protein
MKLINRFIATLLAIGLLAICAEGAFAGPAVGSYFSAGNPGGLRYSSQYLKAQTHAKADQNWLKIGRQTYNTEARDFESPWPFGPEGGAQ